MRKREEILSDITEIAEDLSVFSLVKLLWCAQGLQQIEREDGIITK